MKISNKEKIMLYVLGSIIIGFLYYQFVYLPQLDDLHKKISMESEIKQKYDTTMNTIKSMEDKKSDVKILNAKINYGSVSFYPTINQEKIIIELDKLLRDNNLEGSVTFQPIVSNSVENSKKEIKSLAESSLQSIVDQYNYAFGSAEKEQQSSDENINNSIGSQSDTKTSNNADATSNSDNGNIPTNSKEAISKDPKDVKKNTVQYLKCEVKFEGKYEDLDKFLEIIAQNEKKIVVNSIKLSSDTLDAIKGTMVLEFYSIPKLTDEIESYLKWDLDKTYGKSVPFGPGNGGSTSVIKTAADGQEEKGASDFITSVKSVTSDLPTVMIGKANDELRTTYAYADSNSEEKVEMILTQDGDKYYYKYKTSKGTFPTNYDGLGAEFVPASKNIVLDMLSESKVNANDNAAINLKIINKTDKLVNVNISGDDFVSPRVIVDADSSNVSVNKG